MADQFDDLVQVRASKQGMSESFDVLVRRYTGPVFRFVLRMVNDVSTAQDIVQESFLKAWRSLRSYDETKSFKTWLFTIARNATLDMLRKRTPIPFSHLERDEDAPEPEDLVPDEQPLADELLMHKDLGNEIQAALDTLPPPARAVVLLHDGEELTFQEIADQSGESLNTVKSRYRRAVLALRKVLLGSAEVKDQGT